MVTKSYGCNLSSRSTNTYSNFFYFYFSFFFFREAVCRHTVTAHLRRQVTDSVVCHDSGTANVTCSQRLCRMTVSLTVPLNAFTSQKFKETSTQRSICKCGKCEALGEKAGDKEMSQQASCGVEHDTFWRKARMVLRQKKRKEKKKTYLPLSQLCGRSGEAL